MSNKYNAHVGTVVALTDKAALLDFTHSKLWVPFSQIFEDDLAGIDVGVVQEFNISAWFCNKEGL